MEGHFNSREVESVDGSRRTITKVHLKVSFMSKRNRRAFLQTSTGVLAAGLIPIGDTLRRSVTADHAASEVRGAQVAPTIPANEGRKPLRLGLIIGIGKDPDSGMAKVPELWFATCQGCACGIQTEIG